MRAKWVKRSLTAVLPIAVLAGFTVVPTGVSSAQTATPWAQTPTSMVNTHLTGGGAGDMYNDNVGGAFNLPNGLVLVTGDSTSSAGS